MSQADRTPPTDASTTAELPAPAGEVRCDTPCLDCGYNLRGLRAGGTCPECNFSIDRSLRGDRLLHASPHRLRRLVAGAELLFWGSAVSLSATIAGAILFFTSILAGWPTAGLLTVSTVLLLGATVALVGVWRITIIIPRPTGWQGHLRVQTVARVAMSIAPACQAYGFVSSILVHWVMKSPGTMPPPPVLPGPSLPCLLATVVGIVALLVHLRRLALCIPDHDLAANVKLYLHVLGGCAAVVVCSLALREWNWSVCVALGLICFVPIAALVLGAWWLRLMARCRNVLRQQAQLAEQAGQRSGENASSDG